MSTVELTQVRPGHEFNEAAIAELLQETLNEKPQKMMVKQFEGGQSNPTFKLTLGDRHFVLRKQPPGKLLPSAHRVDREYQVMNGLANTEIPVPQMIVLCEDPNVIGTSFYIMEHVEGRLLTSLVLPDMALAERTSLYANMIDVLAKLHQVNYEQAGLAEFGKSGNYYTRQLNRWTRQYMASKTIEIPAMDQLIEWLPDQVPEDDETTIVHGDYRLGNLIIHPTEPRILAVLDWELSTLGHPLADLAYLCQNYHTDDDEDSTLNRPDLAELGIPSESAQLERYCKNTAREQINNWTFYLVYNLFRSAAIIQGVYKRGLDGNASSSHALEHKDTCKIRAKRAWQLVTKSDT